MNARRQFFKAVGAGALVAGWSSFARASNPERVKVIGIGGAGCNIVERLREQGWIAVKADILTANRPYSRRSPVDLILGPSDPQLAFSCSEADIERIHALMEGTQQLVLVAGLGGKTGTSLIARFAESARSANVPVDLVVTTPMEFEGKRNAIARRALDHLHKLVGGQLIAVDGNRVMYDLPEDTLMNQAFEYLDDLAIAEVRNFLLWMG